MYGATGFVGRHVAEYLAANADGLRVGLAGRSSARLEEVCRSIGPAARRWSIIPAPLESSDALQALASRCRVLVSTVGPYSKVGLPLVAACALTGTDYLDLAGEIPFVRGSIDLYHDLAAANGARIIHSCGFDSIPSDLTVYALHRRALADGAGDLGRTTLVIRNYSGGCSGGSIHTMVEMMRCITNDPSVRVILDDPYSLSPNRSAEPDLGPQPDLEMFGGSEIAPELAGLWTGGEVMALYNSRCVRRSNALLDWAYGRDLRYTETLSYGFSFAAPIMATMSGIVLEAMSRLGGAYLRQLPPGVVDRALPGSGVGYDQGERGGYKVETYTTTSTGCRYVANMSQRGDPGYSATATLLGLSALLLTTERDRLTDLRGVLTPASAMGDLLLERMPGAGVTLTTTRLSR